MRPDDVRALSREELISRAEDLGVARPRTLTHAELVDEVIRRTSPAPASRSRRGWLGRARDLVASVVEKGLALPEAATLLGRSGRRAPAPPPPLPTVTLAEIYAAQGYFAKAVAVLDEVLLREPGHADARALRERFARQLDPEDRGDLGSAPVASAGAEANAPSTVSTDSSDAGDDEPAVAADAREGAGPSGASTDDDDLEPFDLDDVVGLAMDEETAFAYWEVRPLTFARAEHRHPGGRLVLRVSTSVVHRGGHIESYERDVPIDELLGDCFVRGVPAGSEVRLSVGWKHEGGFMPFAVAPALQMPRPMRDDEPVPPFAAPTESAPGEPPPSAATAPAPPPSTGPMADRMRRTSPLTWVDFDQSEATEMRRRVVRVETRAGGASDLYRVVHEVEESRRVERGGASDLVRGGASDLSGATSRAWYA